MVHVRDYKLPETTPRHYPKAQQDLPKGITFRGDKFVVRVSVRSKRTQLGQYKTLDEAVSSIKRYREANITQIRCCKNCNSEFLPVNARQIFCSTPCKGQWKYVSGETTTQSQYNLISGNWSRYCSRLLYVAGRKREELSREVLLRLLEKQHYKCAISGIPLTCELRVGEKLWTNASIDRIIAGGPYTEGNVQLVCGAVNSWRSNMLLEDFIEVCRKVAETHPREIGG